MCRRNCELMTEISHQNGHHFAHSVAKAKKLFVLTCIRIKLYSYKVWYNIIFPFVVYCILVPYSCAEKMLAKILMNIN